MISCIDVYFIYIQLQGCYVYFRPVKHCTPHIFPFSTIVTLTSPYLSFSSHLYSTLCRPSFSHNPALFLAPDAEDEIEYRVESRIIPRPRPNVVEKHQGHILDLRSCADLRRIHARRAKNSPF